MSNMKSSCKVQMRPLGLDHGSIKTAAEIISLSFASDPLIRWLSRDHSGPGWETLTPTLQQWQEARLREYARIGIMMESHNDFEERIKKKYPPNSLYYLEIAAVRPDTQGMGVGRTIMQWVVQELGDNPCYIECTDKKNVAFYVKYGFELVEEAELVDEEDAMPPTTLFYMIRDTSTIKK
ncbi:hypothetical protein J7337_010876 [Fusarium musae]|uniref:N-acetyltransferase domain-containing protein n=1 Tax=Fusarium musae TaxID=1042133 RepID=A0A9P8D9T8_9HYPO|nr:hypothetical protein J7337_010876 [Fusarium musae]KAG9498000.1 hypothetical protein J7337_010876 [Fusarium musae]